MTGNNPQKLEAPSHYAWSPATSKQSLEFTDYTRRGRALGLIILFNLRGLISSGLLAMTLLIRARPLDI